MSTSPLSTRVFPLVVHPTYFAQGFFNVPVEFDSFVRQREGDILLILGGDGIRVSGRINRTANNNATARVMGGTGLRDWFHRHCEVGQTVYVDLTSFLQIRVLLESPH